MPERHSDARTGDRANGRPPGRDRRRSAAHARRVPIFRLLGYYALLVAAAVGLLELFPMLHDAIMAPMGSEGVGGLTGSVDTSMSEAFQTRGMPENRLLTTGVVFLGTLLLVLPVAWVYTFVRRLRYDRSLVHSLVILPPLVAGIVMVVKNSLALAFSLAGIVAAVRFRTTVKDPKDAVHIFLVIGIGLAAGVQALDIALLLSLAFNLIALALWKYDIDAVYGEEDADLLSVGDASMLLAGTPEGRHRAHERLEGLAEEIKTDGLLLVHTTDPAAARQVAEVVLTDVAKEWRFRDPPRGRNGVWTLEAVIRLKKKSSPVDLLGELEDRWSPTVAAAEYVPYSPYEYDDDD
ncbi:MAG: DUF4956 domain-containing protein [Gemmatimonadetes bacterium]|nr:DUF4956 domain-containing protein [Gemmatimonadota bacterium]